jgi:hypothetical protein
MAPTPVSEVIQAIAQKTLELLPAHLRPLYGSISVRIVFQEGKPVKIEGGIETAQRK